MDSRQKQADYRKRMNAKGMAQITEWIPEADRAYFRQIARELREGRRPQEQVVSAPPPKPPTKPRTATKPHPAVSTAPPSPGTEERSSVEAKPRNYTRYPSWVKRQALEMREEGIRPVEIRGWITDQVGKSPSYKDFAKVLNEWQAGINKLANTEKQ